MEKFKLYQALNYFSKEQLLTMCRVLRYSGYSKLNKLELAKHTAKFMLLPAEMTGRLGCLSDRAYALFEKAVATEYLEVSALSEEECAAVDCLSETMYVGMNSTGTKLYVYEDVKVAFSAFDASAKFHELRKQISWMLCCLKLSTYLYSVVPEDILHKLYFKHPDFQSQESTRIDVLAMVMIPQDIMLVYFGQLKENIIPGYKDVYISDLWVDDYERLLLDQGNKSFYIPTYEEIVDFSEHGYLQNNPSCKAMRQFLIDNFNLKARDLYKILSLLWEGSALGEKPQMVLQDFLEETGLELSERKMEKLISLVLRLHNNTRTIINRGHTPNELSRLSQIRPLPLARPNRLNAPEDFTELGMLPLGVKVGRNDPCPCGSGEKYKRCCGR